MAHPQYLNAPPPGTIHSRLWGSLETDNDLDMDVLPSQAPKWNNKDHGIKIIRQLPWFFHLGDGEFIFQEISSLRLGFENKWIKNRVAISISKI